MHGANYSCEKQEIQANNKMLSNVIIITRKVQHK